MVDNVRTPQVNVFCIMENKRDSFFGAYTTPKYFIDMKSAMDFAERNRYDSIHRRSEVCNNPEDGGESNWRNAFNVECAYKDGEWHDVDWKGDICGKYLT